VGRRHALPRSLLLYFGDDAGSPGTILTFFPWPNAARGHAGAGEVAKTACSGPAAALEYWHQRLRDQSLLVERTGKRFDEQVLTFPDPDGMQIEIVAHADAGAANASRFASVPTEHGIREPPGFTFDEPIESLGEELCIPQWLEPKRSFIEKRLPPVTLHKSLPPIELQTDAGATV
jgi:catechol 2,3-dioxygenase-like lactoylglutathione lyase family enzyme